MCIDGLDQVQVHQLYRAMDPLIENHEHVQGKVFFSTANLLHLDIDLIYFDTTSTCFEVDPDPIKRRLESAEGVFDLEELLVTQVHVFRRQGVT